jgi:hypothetical protein
MMPLRGYQKSLTQKVASAYIAVKAALSHSGVRDYPDFQDINEILCHEDELIEPYSSFIESLGNRRVTLMCILSLYADIQCHYSRTMGIRLNDVQKQRRTALSSFGRNPQYLDRMDFLFKHCIEQPDGSFLIPKQRVDYRKRQMQTLYAELSEPEKDEDRNRVDRLKEVAKPS